MNINWDLFINLAKIKSEESLSISDLWIARSAIGINMGNKAQLVFGFAAGFDRAQCEISAMYELLEHLVFMPSLHNEHSADQCVTYEDSSGHARRSVREFLTGVRGPQGIFYGNGCAVSTNRHSAIKHAQRELLERHICCEIWYQKKRRLLRQEDIKIKKMDPKITLDVYTADIVEDGEFALAVLDSADNHFFAVGAALKSNLQEAIHHAVGEVSMVFDDVKKDRRGMSTTQRAQEMLLSLRDEKFYQQRKNYFESLINSRSVYYPYISPKCDTVVFEPLPKIFAARSFSTEALDPRLFEAAVAVPTLPLF